MRDTQASRLQFSENLHARIVTSLGEQSAIEPGYHTRIVSLETTGRLRTHVLFPRLGYLIPALATAVCLTIVLMWPGHTTSLTDPASELPSEATRVAVVPLSLSDEQAWSEVIDMAANEIGFLLRTTDTNSLVDWERNIEHALDGVLAEFLLGEHEPALE